MNMRSSWSHEKIHSNTGHLRIPLLTGSILMLSLTLILRLAYLQFSQYKRYATLSLKNQMSIIPMAPPRGIIMDRFGTIVADNKPIYVLEVIPERAKHIQQSLQKLQTLMPSLTDEDLNNFYRTKRQSHAYIPIPLKMNLTKEEVAIFASNQYLFPGISIHARLMRYYPFKESMSHVLGYVGRMNVDDLKQFDNPNYHGTLYVGKAGIEKYYESLLHGTVGYQQVETDVSGRILRTLSKQTPLSGDKLYLTIDMRLQTIAYDAFKQISGAAILMNAKNGEILAMVSAPGYDPNLFVNGIPKKTYQTLSLREDRPLYNRATRGLYPPASTVKPFIGLAGLDKEVISQSTQIYDPGWYKLPGISHFYRDWKHTGHGVLNITRAITVSCDTYFYQLGNKLGITSISDMLTRFGFGQLTRIDLNEEAQGVVPNPQWKKRTKGQYWYPGDTLITSIGQGFMLATPIQLARAVAIMSQRGRLLKPHLLYDKTNDEQPESINISSTNKSHKPHHRLNTRIQLKNTDAWDIVIQAMHAVTTSPEGTGYRFGRNPPYPVAAKTGTAQVFTIAQNKHASDLNIPAKLRDHSLFIAFAPVDDPKIAIAVVVEHDVAASFVARTIMDAYFQLYPLTSS